MSFRFDRALRLLVDSWPAKAAKLFRCDPTVAWWVRVLAPVPLSAVVTAPPERSSGHAERLRQPTITAISPCALGAGADATQVLGPDAPSLTLLSKVESPGSPGSVGR